MTILAAYLSIPAIVVWVMPYISTYTDKITIYVLTAWAILTWFTMLILVLRGPGKNIITSCVPAAPQHYADAGTSVLVIYVLSFMFVALIVLITEIFIHYTFLASQVQALIPRSHDIKNMLHS